MANSYMHMNDELTIFLSNITIVVLGEVNLVRPWLIGGGNRGKKKVLYFCTVSYIRLRFTSVVCSWSTVKNDFKR